MRLLCFESLTWKAPEPVRTVFKKARAIAFISQVITVIDIIWVGDAQPAASYEAPHLQGN
jgi:hypothetical protein